MEKGFVCLSKKVPDNFVLHTSKITYSNFDVLAVYSNSFEESKHFLKSKNLQTPVLIITLGKKFALDKSKDSLWTLTVTEPMLVCLNSLVDPYLDLMLTPSADASLEFDHFEHFFEKIPANMYFKDTESRILRVNHTFKQYLMSRGISEFIGKTDHDIFTPEHANKAYEDEQLILKTGNPIIGLGEKETWSGGKVSWASTTKLPVRNDAGKIIGIMGFSFDITQRKESEIALFKSEERLHLAADAAKFAMFDWDLTTGEVHWDKQMHYIFELKTDDSIQRNDYFFSVLHPEDRDRVAKTFEWTLNPENPDLFSLSIYRILLPKNRIKYLETKSNLFRNEKGEVLRIVGTCLDITESKLKEQELIATNDRLVSVTKALEENNKSLEKALIEARRSNELAKANKKLESTLQQLKNTQAQMIHMEKMASVGVLAAGIAHELNNPLNFISGGVLALENQTTQIMAEHGEKIEPLISAIKTGVERSTAIIKSLNHFNRKSDSNLEECNIRNIVQNCILILQNRIKPSIKVKTRFAKNSLVFKGNEGELHQVILNILTNAVQALDGKGTVSISSHFSEDHTTLTVKDSGKGMTKEVLSKIRDPFFTTKGPGQGTGLGISIAESIVQKHHGEITFTSKRGTGTTVKIILPNKV
ncbi:MAG: PAS domain-containing protein [Reichenbachiella sp.]